MLEPRPYQKRAIDAAINLDYEKIMRGAGFDPLPPMWEIKRAEPV